MTAAVIASIRVDAKPLRAFEAFTEEIGEWWRPNPLFALTPGGDGHLRFGPGEGGRLVATLANGKEFEDRPHHRLEARRKARTHMASGDIRPRPVDAA
jgi:hypothetical protein